MTADSHTGTDSQRPPAPPAVPGWAKALIALGGLLVAGLATVIVLLVLGGGSEEEGSTAEDKAEAEAATFDVRGELTLIDANNENYAGGCFGGGGYDDMIGGTQVIIRDSTSKTIAVGRIEDGVKEDIVTCVFSFAIDDVPSGSAPYSVEVSHRGEIAFNEEDSEGLSLTLG